MKELGELTTGLGRSIEDCSNLGVHRDGQASVNHELLVPSLDLSLDPVCEDVLQD